MLKQWCGYRAALGWGRPARGPGGDRHLHGRIPRLPARPGHAKAAARRRPDQRPDRHPARGSGAAHAAEIASILFSLSFAGHETTTGLIGNTVRRLLEDRGAGPRSRPIPASSRPRSKRPCATTLRCRSGAGSPPGRSRWAAPPARKGQAVPLAGRRRPGRRGIPPAGPFDLHRPDSERHLAFGQGLHYCLGANLGKLEAQIAVAELARRLPRLRLAPDQRADLPPEHLVPRPAGPHGAHPLAPAA